MTLTTIRFKAIRHTAALEAASVGSLYLEATAAAAATCPLELAALGAHERLGVALLAAGRAEVLDRLAVGLAGTQQHRVAASRRDLRQLVEGEDLAAGREHALAGGGGEGQRADAQLGGPDHAHVIGDLANNDGNLVLLALHVAREARDGHGRAVHLGGEQALEHDRVELRVRAASEEAVKLHQKRKVNVVRFGCCAHLVVHVAAAGYEIDTHSEVVCGV